MKKKRWLIFRLFYLLVLILGAVAIYILVPDELWTTIKDAYWNTTASP